MSPNSFAKNWKNRNWTNSNKSAWIDFEKRYEHTSFQYILGNWYISSIYNSMLPSDKVQPILFSPYEFQLIAYDPIIYI